MSTKSTKKTGTTTDLSELTRLAERCAKHGIPLQDEYSLNEAFVLIEKSPVWTRRMFKTGRLAGRREMTKTLSGASREKIFVAAASLEEYLMDDEEEVSRESARRANPAGYYAAARRTYRSTSVEDLTPEQAQKMIDALRKKLENL
jgi:hypothetical protein